MLAYSLDGRTLISAGNDHIVKFWDVATGKERFRLEGHVVLAISPQAGCFASRDTSATAITKSVSIRSLATGEPLAGLAVNDIWTMCAAFSPDGKLAAAGGFDWGVSVYELATATLKGYFTGHQDYVIAIAFSPDGKTVASASQDRTVKLWNLATGQEIRTLVGHTGPVTSIAFAPDGKRLVSGSYDKTVRIWNLEAIN
jgi:WD40 repeat protein